MRRVLISIIVIAVGGSLGLAAAIGVGALTRQSALTSVPGTAAGYGWQGSGRTGPGMMGGGVPSGMMGSWYTGSPTGQRLSMDQIAERAAQYAASYGQNFDVAEVMEFSENFYAVIREKDTGRGAFEILLDPYTGQITGEPGPNMMWNAKYSHMGGWAGGDNTLTLEQARALAQKALDASTPGGKVHEDARAFYGYYTFDYDINGQTAGMLSVNGTSGAVWPHTWHGQFISETEMN
jgi:hypothetical protein